MRLIPTLVIALAQVGCAGVFRGPDTCMEIHFDATDALARWAGWPAEEALAIASSDAWTDLHPGTSSVATERRLVAGLVNPLAVPWVRWRESGGEAPFGRALLKAEETLRCPAAARRRSPGAPAVFRR